MGMLSLPNELLLIIAQDFSVKDLYRLLSTCSRLSSLFIQQFQELALQDVGSLTALQWAARHGHAPLAELVLSKGAREAPNNGKWRRCFQSPLYMAATHNHPDVIRVLAKYGERMTARSLFGAANQGFAQVIKVLLELGANMASVQSKRTPVHISAGRGDIDSMRAFIDAGLDFHLEDGRGRTVLHEAIATRRVAMTEFLLGHGAKEIVNARDSTGKTPLHWAVFGPTANEEVVKLLCYHGADPEVADNLGNTPVGLALEGRRGSLTSMLLEHLYGESFGSGTKL